MVSQAGAAGIPTRQLHNNRLNWQVASWSSQQPYQPVFEHNVNSVYHFLLLKSRKHKSDSSLLWLFFLVPSLLKHQLIITASAPLAPLFFEGSVGIKQP